MTMDVTEMIEYIKDAGEEVSPSFILDQLDNITTDPKVHSILTVYFDALNGRYDGE